MADRAKNVAVGGHNDITVEPQNESNEETKHVGSQLQFAENKEHPQILTVMSVDTDRSNSNNVTILNHPISHPLQHFAESVNEHPSDHNDINNTSTVPVSTEDISAGNDVSDSHSVDSVSDVIDSLPKMSVDNHYQYHVGQISGETIMLSPEDSLAQPQHEKNGTSSRDSQQAMHMIQGEEVTEDFSTPRRNGSRRVYFPADGSVVSGYMDPPSPWVDVTTCSTEDLVEAYKKACEKLGSKPIPRLLSQLHAITDFCDRNETLSLRGDKLDQRHCETLEEILRRVQFRTLDLEATHLEEEGAIALFDMVEYYESATRLNISYNRGIGPRGWQSCARMLKKTPCLEHLEAKNCQITEQIMPMLGRALRLGSMLATLHLENCMLAGRPLMILVAAIKMNDTLRELFLADNKLIPSDGIQLGNMLKLNHTLHVLDVRNNHLQDMGLSHICEGLCEQIQGRGLNTLVLWNNQITYQSMSALSRALSVTKQIETLNLGHNSLSNEGIHRLKDGFLQNKSLLRLGLQAAKISCEGAVALAEYIAESPRLLRADLRENDVKTGGLMALALSLKVSKSVSRVDLDREPKRESGVKDYAEQQRRLLSDITNYMHRNREMARQKEEAEEEEEQLKRMKAEAQMLQQQQQMLQQQELEAQQAIKPEVAHGADKSGMTLALSHPFTQRSQTLESPAFVTEANMPVMDPPDETQQARPPAAKEKVPMTFPPSPMVLSNGKPMLAAITEGMDSFASPQLDGEDEQTLPSLSAIEEEAHSSNRSKSASTQELSPDEVDIFVKGIDHHIPAGGDATSEHLPNIHHSTATPHADGLSSKIQTDSQSTDSYNSSSSLNICDNRTQGDIIPVSPKLTEASDIGVSAVEQSQTVSDAKPLCVLEQVNTSSNSMCDTDSAQHGTINDLAVMAELKTNLTQNGMCNELASLVDSLDNLPADSLDSAYSEDVLSSPDEFERELDEMLASVQPTLVIQADDIPDAGKHSTVENHPLS